MKKVIDFIKWLFSPNKWFKAKKSATPIETESIYRGTRAIKKQGNLTLWQMDPNTGIVQRAPVTEEGLKDDKGMVYIWSLKRRNAVRHLKAQGFKPADGQKEEAKPIYTSNEQRR